MKTILAKAVLIGCLFVSVAVKAQNPFITRADIIANFDISPDNQQVCCKWWGADAMFKFRIKDLNTHRVFDIDSISAKESAALCFADGISFLSNRSILVGKDKAILSYDTNSHKQSKLFNLPSLASDNPTSLAVTKDKKGIYLLGYQTIYYADLQSGIQDSVCLNKDDLVMGISATSDNRVVYAVEKKEKAENIHQIWAWDGQTEAVNVTEQFSKVIKVPYLIEATSAPDLYIVANTEGIFRFDQSTQQATKLVDNPKENPVIIIRISADAKTVYYLTYYDRAKIRTMDMNGMQGESISF